MSKKIDRIQSSDKKQFEKQVNEYHKGDYKFTEEGNLKDSKKEGLWKTYIHFEIETHIIGVDYDPENPKIINSGKYGKSLFKEETFLNGELHGLYKTYQWDVKGNWVKDEGFYENGRKTGEWISHGKLGGRYVCNYKNGKENGSCEGYDFSGERLIYKGTMKDDKRHGKWIEYRSHDRQRYHKGKYEKELIYKNGLLHGHCKFYESMFGYLEREGTMKNDKPDGLWKYYNYSGKLTSERNMKDGKIHGRTIDFHSDGKHYSEQFYKHGKLIESTPDQPLSTQP